MRELEPEILHFLSSYWYKLMMKTSLDSESVHRESFLKFGYLAWNDPLEYITEFSKWYTELNGCSTLITWDLLGHKILKSTKSTKEEQVQKWNMP